MPQNNKIKRVINEFKNNIVSKYDILDLKLFGSCARGDNSGDSDIDIMVKIPEVTREIEEDLYDIAYDLELKHDCLIDVVVLSDKYNSTPLYQNIRKNGIGF